MKKKIIIAVLGGVVLIIGLLAVAGWVLFTGVGFVADKAPGLVQDGRRIATEALRRTKEAIPGVREKAEQMAPGVSEKIGSMLPGEDVPERDVGGEDIPGIARHAGMVRTAYMRIDGKREVTYLGAVDYRSVVDFYTRQLKEHGFVKTVVSATPDTEMHEYRKADRLLKLVFEKQSRFGVERTKMTIAEIKPDL